MVESRLNEVLGPVWEELRQVRHWLKHDELTGLPNRRALASHRRDHPQCYFVRIDLNGFKDYQDQRRSHAAGDEILREFAQWLQGSIRRSDLVRDADRAYAVRVSGDEFVVCTDSETGAIRICSAVRGWCSKDGGVTASAGHGPTEKEADRMMYLYKEQLQCVRS